ncbi:MAG: RNA pseudouridine synthase [Proteobacteria bacterium]|nr:RNA pseudouridine synthase [Pseudomonadota bacterium]MCP4922283.1 RNA pseudouridine synthase [Pseudomonadota bacterium]
MTPRLLTRFGDVFYAFDKPAGMAVHPNAEKLADLTSWIQEQRSLPRSLKPVHRLDKPTSGVVLCGAGRAARRRASEMLASSRKRYLALVAGDPVDEAEIDMPLRIDKKDVDAVTRFQVIERFQGFALLELELITGRKHQLRRHLSMIELPVVGDTRYGPKRPKRVPAFPGRLWLHAWKLDLEDRLIEAKLPAELEAHLEVLRG